MAEKVVIVGSGIGGLVSGVILSKWGYEVTILEKNRQIGGNLQIFSRNKKIFDTGVHYIGGLAPGQNLNQFFDYLGILEKLPLQRLDPSGYDQICIDGESEPFPLAEGYENLVSTLALRFPEEKTSLEAYAQWMKTTCSDFKLYNLEWGIDEIDSPSLHISIWDKMLELVPNPLVRKILLGQHLLYAPKSNTPAHIHALVVNSYIQSAWKIKGGAVYLAKALAEKLKENGGKIITHAEVTGWETDTTGKLSSALTKDGKTYSADIFISSLHPKHTFDQLEHPSIRKAYKTRLAQLENGSAALVANIVLKPGTIVFKNHNLYVLDDAPIESHANLTTTDWPAAIGVFMSPDAKNEGFAETITLMAAITFEEWKTWADTFHTDSDGEVRNASYETYKNSKANQLIDKVSPWIPMLKENINAIYVATPLTYRDYTGTPDGSMYGIDKDFRDPMKSFISPRTKIENLFLTGQNIHMHGVLGVTVSAFLTCFQIIGYERLMGDIYSHLKKEPPH